MPQRAFDVAFREPDCLQRRDARQRPAGLRPDEVHWLARGELRKNAPRGFGFHEVFHTLTILAFGAHFVAASLALSAPSA